MRNVAAALSEIATVAMIVVVTRWVLTAHGPAFPRLSGSLRFYGLKWQWRAVAFVGSCFWIGLTIWSWVEAGSPKTSILVVTLVFVLIGVWLGSGSVITGESGIERKAIWRSHSLRWKDITEIRLHQRHGDAIELRAGSKRMTIDSRFVATQELLEEIVNHTRLDPIQL